MSTRTDNAYVARPLTGGLDTKSPPTGVAPSSSPDLLNVTLSNRAVERRGGFTPLIRQHPPMNSLVNRGYRAACVANTDSGALNTDVLHVPGYGVAGHRPIYNTIAGGYAVEFFFSPDHLIREHVGNGAATGSLQFKRPAPYDLVVRPILSKGPLKKTGDPTATIASWVSTDTHVWGDPGGPHSTFQGMPFCFWLGWDGSAWRFNLSFHSLTTAPLWKLNTLAVSSIAATEGGVYHVIGSFSQDGGTCRLRVARIDQGSDPSYGTDSVTLAAGEILARSECPIQVFDCPQEFIEATTVGTADQRPGLGLNGNDESYFFSAKRAEGRIEDIAIWGSDLLSEHGVTTLDRSTKLDHSAPLVILDLGGSGENDTVSPVSLWPMTKPGMNRVDEVAGSGNPIYLAPAGPSYAQGTSATPAGAWFFNGLTSYGQAQIGASPNWIKVEPGADNAAFYDAVRNNIPHGMEVTFWCDGIEPQYEQVVMEIHSVMRLAIDTDGTLKVYVRHPDGNAYVVAGSSTHRIKPGFRYHVVVMRRQSSPAAGDRGKHVQLLINRAEDASSPFTVSPDNSTAAVIGGITWGMGAAELLAHESPPPTADQVNTDHRSGFVGLIESARLLLGESNSHPPYKDEDEDDWQHRQARLWRNDSDSGGAPRVFEPLDDNDLVWAPDNQGGVVGEGLLLRFGDDRYAGKPIGYPESRGVSFNPNQYLSIMNARKSVEGGHTELVGAQLTAYFVFARWVFNVDDRDSQYPGAYHHSTEVRGGGSWVPNPHKSVHVQWSAVTDQLGMLGGVQKCTIESDFLTENPANWTVTAWQHRVRPYGYRAPLELAPYQGKGLVLPALGQNPISLIHDWRHGESGERFIVAGCGRQLYWVRRVWRAGSPFADEPAGKTLWLFGGAGEHVSALSTSDANQQFTGANTITIDCWVRPDRLDGTRLIALKSGGGASGDRNINYAIFTVDGVVHVLGTQAGKTGTWLVRGGEAAVADTNLRVREWSHIHVSMGDLQLGAAAVSIHVNGTHIPSITPVGYDDIGDAIPDQGTNTPLFLGGMPTGQNVITHAHGVLELGAWCGQVTDFKQRNVWDASFPATADGQAPQARSEPDADTYYLFAMSEGEGWGLQNLASAVPNDGASLHMEELVCLKEGLDESSAEQYRAVVFRDRLYVTNGLSEPQEIQHTRFSDSKGPFRCYRVGMQPPAAIGVSRIVPSGMPTGSQFEDGLYQVVQTFVDADGRESDPVLVSSFSLSSNPANPRGFVIDACPRSVDPQVVARRFYLSASGGGAPLLHSTHTDTDSRQVELFDPPTGVTGAGDANMRLPAPRGKLVSVSAHSLLIANLTDEPAGAGAFAWSQAREPSYFPGAQTVVIDSSDGNPILSVFEHLGRLYQSKRSSIWFSDLNSILSAGPRPVSKSVGVGGGTCLYDNVIYGAGERGVYRFDGANAVYASSELEGLWDGIDVSDEALSRTHGAFYWRDSQFWLSVRRLGQQPGNDEILVLHTAAGPAPAWTRFRVPEHSYLAALLDAEDQEPLIVIGTQHGQLLRYHAEIFVDGHDAGRQDSGSVALFHGSILGVTQDTVDVSPTPPPTDFDVIGPGFRGVQVRVSWTTDPATGARDFADGVILRNTRNRLYLASPVIQTGFTAYQVEIGGYPAYWTSGWIAPQRFGSFVRMEHVDLEFEPEDSGDLTLRLKAAINGVGTAREFDDTGSETQTVDMDDGWVSEPARGREQNQGRYVRIKLGTDGVQKPFSVSAWGMRWTESGQRGGRSAS